MAAALADGCPVVYLEAPVPAGAGAGVLPALALALAGAAGLAQGGLPVAAVGRVAVGFGFLLTVGTSFLPGHGLTQQLTGCVPAGPGRDVHAGPPCSHMAGQRVQ